MFFPAGPIRYHPGSTLPAQHNVRIRLFGVGAHGSMPQKGIDPVVMASALVMRLQTIVSREIAPGEMAVVTVGAVNIATRYKIINEVAAAELRIRTFKEEVLQSVYSPLTCIAQAVS